jgi:hypothetical protein
MIAQAVSGIPTIKSCLSSLCNCGTLGYEVSQMPTEELRFFDVQDVQLLTHLNTVTSLDLHNGQKIWTEDVMKLAFQVCHLLQLNYLDPIICLLNTDKCNAEQLSMHAIMAII